MSAFKRRLEALLKGHRAVLIFTGGLPKHVRDDIDGAIASIPTLPTRYLKDFEKHSLTQIREIDDYLGLLSPLDFFVRLADQAMNDPGDLFFVPKAYVEQTLFRRYDKLWGAWSTFPPHTRIGFDAKNRQPYTGRTVEWRLLEAALFEDLAMLWNESLSAAVAPTRTLLQEEKIPYKRWQVLKRSAARAVFSLLEGYVNGISTDIQWTTDIHTLTPAQREMLTERSDDGRQKFKQLRDKVMQYPRIALRAEHPPIQESSLDLALVLKREREWRDAFMHPSPKIAADLGAAREQAFFEIDQNDLAALVDAAIGLIKRIDSALNGMFGRVSLWLADRNTDGRFDNKVFY